MTRPTRATRELACLALAHDDQDAASCPSTDDDLMRHLVEEVQRLRVAAGIVEETETDRAEQAHALQEAIADTEERQGYVQGPDVLASLSEDGWRLIRSSV